MTDTPEEPNLIADRLRLAAGFLASERDWVIGRLAALGSRLRSFPGPEVDLEISLKERHGADQRVTLECWISRTPRLHLVATSTARELAMAVNEVRNDLIRQVDDAKTRTEPRDDHVRPPPLHTDTSSD